MDDQRFTVNNIARIASTSENTIDVQSLEKKPLLGVLENLLNNVVEIDRIQNANAVALGNIVTPRIKLASSSINALPRQDAASVSTSSLRGKQVKIFA